MVIQDESSDEEVEEPDLTPPSPSKSSLLQPATINVQQSTDVDDEPFQCSSSPPAHHETQVSHSSKAEQQLQNEWFSYSQYVNTRSPQSSSMHVAHDTFNNSAASMSNRPATQIQQPSTDQYSQATTVDEVTPKKNRTLGTSSANVTPHRIMSSPASFVSPNKPPPLYIPSSFPSLADIEMNESSSSGFQGTEERMNYMEGLFGESWEEMSIPPPPPIEED